MKKAVFCLLAIYAGLCAAATDFTGWWSAKVAGIPISVHISRTTSDPGMRAVLFSPTQSADSIPIDAIRVSGDSIILNSSALHACFAAVKNGKKLTGTFRQGTVSLPITLKRSSAADAIVRRPQTPVPPYQHAATEVTVRRDTSLLAGTLTMPVTDMPAGAVVFITGSGKQDRDETIMGHKPYAVIADWLTRAGWATLRCDDRGVGGSTPDELSPDYNNLAADPLAQIDYLRSLPQLKGKPIGIIGHSEGATIAFTAAAEKPEQVDFIISLAGPGVKGSELLLRQNEMIAGHFLTPADRQTLVELFTLIGSDKASEEIHPEVTRLASVLVPPAALEKMVQQSLSPDYRRMVSYDPGPIMQRVKCPVLAINGDNDLQVDASQNLTAIAAAIPSATIKELPHINHLMQPCNEPTLNYSAIDTTIAPEVLKNIYAFLLTTLQ